MISDWKTPELFKDGRFMIYALVDPRNGLIKYIGASTMPQTRLNAHRCKSGREGCSKRKREWLSELAKDKLTPALVILDEAKGWVAAQEKEEEYITLHRKTVLNRHTSTAEVNRALEQYQPKQ